MDPKIATRAPPDPDRRNGYSDAKGRTRQHHTPFPGGRRQRHRLQRTVRGRLTNEEQRGRWGRAEDVELERGHGAPRGSQLVSERNAMGGTPLYSAAANGEREVFNLLKVAAACEEVLRRDDGCTILHAAIMGEHYSTFFFSLSLSPT
ncbi:hypothetical protein C3L33_20275, partial [Rhododendron williamsianum]